MHSFFWLDWRSPDLADFLRTLHDSGQSEQALAVLPLAATEQHGPHLPLSVDSDIALTLIQAVVDKLSPHSPIFFLPLQSIGLSTEHQGFSGTLTLSPTTALHLWQDIAEGVVQSGIKKLLLWNTHGGNVGLMDVAAREIRARHKIAVWHSSWFNLPLPETLMQQIPPHEQRFGIHAGLIETAIMMANHPQRVALERLQNFSSSAEIRAKNYPLLGDGRSAKLGWMMGDYNREGAAGDCRGATPELGQSIIENSSTAFAQLLSEMSAIALDQVLS